MRSRILIWVLVVAAGTLSSVKSFASDKTECPVTVVGSKARAMIEAEARAQGQDEKLAVSVGEQESNLGTNVNSSAGARGIMQLMPDTAALLGVKDICDPAQNIRGGVRFLGELSKKYHGNIMLVLAGYNAGMQRVDDAKGIPAVAETVRYVASITNRYYGLANNFPAQAGEKKLNVLVFGKPQTSTADTKGQHWIGNTVLILDGE